MTGIEFAFLVAGAALGLAVGMALVYVLRAPPAGQPEVRLTVTPGSVLRRATTLSTSGDPETRREGAHGGPADPVALRIDRLLSTAGDEVDAEARDDRSAGRAPVGIPVQPELDMDLARLRAGPVGARLAALPEAPLHTAAAVGRPVAGSRGDPSAPGPNILTSAGMPPPTAMASRLGATPEPTQAPPPGAAEPAPGSPAGGDMAPDMPASQAIRSRSGPGPTAGTGDRGGPRSDEAPTDRAGEGDRSEDGPVREPVAIRIEPGTAEADLARVLGLAGLTTIQARPSDRPPGTEAADDAGIRAEAPARAGPAAGAVGEPPAATAGMPRAPEMGDAVVEGVAVAAGPCGEARRSVEQQCGLSERLRASAEAAAQTLRESQRRYDDHQTRADEAATTADGRAVRSAKEDAQRTFRAARRAAQDRHDIEAAARTWLSDINRINRGAREATVELTRERDAANALATVIERQTIEADAARIAAERAAEACIAARERLADCEEAIATGRTPASERPGGAGPVESGDGQPEIAWPPADDQEEPVLPPPGSDSEPAIYHLLRGDRAVLRSIVSALAEGDPSEERRWQLLLTDLVDGLIALAIDSATLVYPEEHPFWGPFTRPECREITGALSSLGYRFDGLGGFMDGRVPGQRELSLAVGYAGQDPMRIRHWPSEAEMAELFGSVVVAADEFLSAAAPALSLGDLVTILGRRADEMTEMWNAWGRVRPLLLSVP